jgi:hypothetical protein
LHIVDSLQWNNSLTRLNLTCCFFTEKGLRALPEVLKKNKSLLDLTLLWCQYDADDIDILGLFPETLAVNNSLTSLNCNGVTTSTPATLERIASSIEKNQTLVNLVYQRQDDFSEISSEIDQFVEINRRIFRAQVRIMLCALFKGRLIEKLLLKTILDMSCQ